MHHCLEKTPEERFQNVRDLIFDLESLPPAVWTAEPRACEGSFQIKAPATAFAVFLLAAAHISRDRWTVSTRAEVRSSIACFRLTDFPGLEEFPAISPDGRSVAFTASVDGRRQMFVRLLGRGSPMPITKDAVDHQSPRWSPDGNSLFYFSPAAPGDAQGAIWSIPALGGSPRRVITSIGDADVSRNGRLACFRLAHGGIQLVTSSLEGTDVRLVTRSAPGYHRHPRWSPDGRWIAFQRGDGVRFDIFVTSPDDGRDASADARQEHHQWSGVAS